jgi:hypothetical protein
VPEGNLLSLYVHRHHDYRAYGASGGVCGVIFAYILVFPGATLFQAPLPFPIPAWLYAIGFMVGSFYGMKSARDNIGHDAHLGGAIIGLLTTAALEPQALRYNWKIFLVVLIAAALLLVYLWRNPMMLPGMSWFARRPDLRQATPDSAHRQRQKQMDAILEKIASEGVGSLTKEESALLQEVSEQYRRRAESKKPESGLAI